jgi:hypothetical protein
MKIAISGSRNTTPEMGRAVMDWIKSMAERHAGNLEFLVGDAKGIDATVISAIDRLNLEARKSGRVGPNETYIPYQVFGASQYKDRDSGQLVPNKYPFRNHPKTGVERLVEGDYGARDRALVDQADLFYAFGDTPGTQKNYNYARKNKVPSHQFIDPGQLHEYIDTERAPVIPKTLEAPAWDRTGGQPLREYFGQYKDYLIDKFHQETDNLSNRTENRAINEFIQTGNLYTNLGPNAFEAAQTAGLMADLAEQGLGGDPKQLRNIAANYQAIHALNRYPTMEAAYQSVNQELSGLYETKPWERTDIENQRVAELQTQKILATRLLQAQDPNDPYWQLRYAVADVQHGATKVTSAVQNFLASRIHEQYVSAYGEVMGVPASELAEKNKKEPNFLRAFARENRERPSKNEPSLWEKIETRALASPIDLTALRAEKVGFYDGSRGTEVKRSFGQIYPDLKDTMTTREVGGLVTSSILDGIRKRAKLSSAQGENWGDVISNVAVGAQGALAFYTPQLLDEKTGLPVLNQKTGNPVSSSAARFALRQGTFLNTAWRRREQQIDSANVGLSSGSDNDDAFLDENFQFADVAPGAEATASDTGTALSYLGPDDQLPLMEDPTGASEDNSAIHLLRQAVDANPHFAGKIRARGVGDVLGRLGFEFTTPSTPLREQLLGSDTSGALDTIMLLSEQRTASGEMEGLPSDIVSFQPRPIAEPDGKGGILPPRGGMMDVGGPMSVRLTTLQASDLSNQLTSTGTANVPITDADGNVITIAAKHRPGQFAVPSEPPQFWQEVVDHFKGKRSKLARPYTKRADELNREDVDGVPVGLFAPSLAPYFGHATFEKDLGGGRRVAAISPLVQRIPEGQEDLYQQVSLQQKDVERWGEMYQNDRFPQGAEGRKRFELLRDAINEVHEDISKAGGSFDELTEPDRFEELHQSRERDYVSDGIVPEKMLDIRQHRQLEKARNGYVFTQTYQASGPAAAGNPARYAIAPAPLENSTRSSGTGTAFISSDRTGLRRPWEKVNPSAETPPKNEVFPEPEQANRRAKTVAYPPAISSRLDRALHRMQVDTNRGAPAPAIMDLKQPLDPKLARLTRFVGLPAPRMAEKPVPRVEPIGSGKTLDGPQFQNQNIAQSASIEASLSQQRDLANVEYNPIEYDPYDPGEEPVPDYRTNGVLEASVGDKNRKNIPANITNVTDVGDNLPAIPTEWGVDGKPGRIVGEAITPPALEGDKFDLAMRSVDEHQKRTAAMPGQMELPLSGGVPVSEGGASRRSLPGQIPPLIQMNPAQKLLTSWELHRVDVEEEHTANAAQALLKPGETPQHLVMDEAVIARQQRLPWNGISMQGESDFSWHPPKNDDFEDDSSVNAANDEAYENAIKEDDPSSTMANIAAHALEKGAKLDTLSTPADAAASTREFRGTSAVEGRKNRTSVQPGQDAPPMPDEEPASTPETREQRNSYRGGTSSVPPWKQTYKQWSAGRSDAKMSDYLTMLSEHPGEVPAGVIADTLKLRGAKNFQNPTAQTMFDQVGQLQPISGRPSPVGGASGHAVPTPGGGHAQARGTWNPDEMASDPALGSDPHSRRRHSGSDIRSTPVSVRAVGGGGGGAGGGGQFYPNMRPQADLIAGNERMMIFGLPGSGKTYAQAARAQRIADPNGKNIFLAMTRSARRALGDKTRDLAGRQLGELSTFHHLGYQILKSLSTSGIETTDHGGRVPIFDPDFPRENILSPLEQMTEASGLMENLRQRDPNTYRFLDPATHSDAYNDQVKSYTEAMEDFRARGWTATDIQNHNPDLPEWYRGQNVDPTMFEGLFTSMDASLRASNQITTGEMVSLPVQVLQRAGRAVSDRILGGYNYIAGDEINQWSPMMTDLFGMLHQANPGAKMSLSGDPLQSPLWGFLGAGDVTMRRLAQITGLNPQSIRENRRLAPETIQAFGRWFGIPASELPTTTNRSRPDLIASNTLAADEAEMNGRIVEGVRGDIGRGVAPKDVTVLTSTRVQAQQIGEQLRAANLQQNGKDVQIWNAPDIRDAFQEMRNNPGNIPQIIQKYFRASVRPKNALAVSTIHGSQSLEARSVHLADASVGSFDQGTTPEEISSNRARMGVAVTRVAEGGNLHLYSTVQNGGQSELVEMGFNNPGQANVQPTPTPAAVAAQAPIPVTPRGTRTNPIPPPPGANPPPPGTPPPPPPPGTPPPVPPPTPPPARGIPVLNPNLVNPASIVNSRIPHAGSVVPDPNGGYAVANGRQEVFSSHEVGTLTNRARDFLSRASDFSSGAVPTNAEDMAKTIHQRFSDLLNNYVKEVASRVKGRPEEGAQVIRATMEKEFMSSVSQEALADMRNQTGYNLHPSYRGRISSRSAGQISSLIASDPELASEVANRGTTAEELASGRSHAITTSLGDYYFGGESNYSGGRRGGGGKSGGGGGGGGGGNIWGKMGSFGKSLYGMYLIGREWKMITGEEQQQANLYAQYMAQTAPMANFNGSDSGYNYLSSDAGILQRQRQSDLYMGHAAQQMYGGFKDAGYLLSGSGDAAGRVITGVKNSLGVGAGSAIALSMMGVGSSAGPAGLAIAGFGILGTGILEAINAANPGREPVTPGSLAADALLGTQDMSAQRQWSDAEEKKLDTEFGIQPGDMPEQTLSKERLKDYETRKGTIQEDAGKLENYTKFLSTQAKVLHGTIYSAGKDTEIKNSALAMQDIGLQEGDAFNTNAYISRGIGRNLTQEESESWAKRAVDYGMSGKDLASEAFRYAQQTGNVEGTFGFEGALNQYKNTAGVSQRSQLAWEGQLAAQYGGQLQAFSNIQGYGEKIADKYGIDTQAEAGPAASFMRAGELYGMNDQGQGLMAGLSQAIGMMHGQQQAALAAPGLQILGAAGFNPMGAGMAIANGNMTNDQVGLFSKIAGGDLGAMSWASYQTGDLSARFMDRSGNPMIQSSGTSAMSTMRAWQQGVIHPQTGEMFRATSLAKINLSSTAAFTGTNNAEINQAFEENGTYGMQLLANQWQYDAQVKSAGIAGAGVALQQQYYWGAQNGGTYDHPAPGSYWNLEDQMTGLQRKATSADFSEQYTRMQMGNKYAVAREENQWERMTASQNYNTWQMNDSRASQLQQRSWTQQDWQFQDQTHALQVGWQMQDFDEAIRYSSGRERRDLIKQRDRSVISNNLNEMQKDTTRERQGEVWAKEDERFEKQKEYQNELNKLDIESFELNKSQRVETLALDQQSWARKKKEWEEQSKIEDQMRALSRKFQADQMDLQMASIGLQVEQAKKQKEINDAMAKTQKVWGDMMGEISNMSNYTQAFNALQAARYLMQAADNTNIAPVNGLKDIFNTIERLAARPDVLRLLNDIFAEIGS